MLLICEIKGDNDRQIQGLINMIKGNKFCNKKQI